jgi:tripartite ATP-independent transporter DctM subunit
MTLEPAAVNGTVADEPVAGEPARAAVPTRAVENVVDALLALALLANVAVVLWTVIARELFSTGVQWQGEFSQLCLGILTFLGAASAAAKQTHVPLRFVVDKLPESGRRVLTSFSDGATVVIAVGVIIFSLPLVTSGWSVKSTELHLPQTVFAIPIPVGMALIVYFVIARIAREWARESIVGILIAIVPGVAVLLFQRGLINLLTGNATSYVLIIALVVGTVAGVPIGFGLLGASILALSSSGLAEPGTVPIQANGAMSNFVLVALPFFVLAGYVMAHGGISRRIAAWADAMVGWLPGGLLQTVVVSMYVFSGVSGSKIADMAAVGTPLSESLSERGFPNEESGAVLVASSVMGETIPPSIALLVTSSVTSLSTAVLFVAGLLPAAALAIMLMLLIIYRTRRMAIIRSPFPKPAAAARSSLLAVPGLAIPVLLIFAIASGAATPTESSSIAVTYALIVSLVFYRMSWDALVRTARQTFGLVGMVLLLVSSANAFSWVLTAVQMPESLASLITKHASQQWVFVLVSMVLLIVVGMILEGLPAIIILAPILLPAATAIGINPVEYSLVLILSMGLGASLPPIGVGFFAGAQISNAKLEKMARASVPYILILLIGILVIGLVPSISTTLPSVFHVH